MIKSGHDRKFADKIELPLGDRMCVPRVVEPNPRSVSTCNCWVEIDHRGAGSMYLSHTHGHIRREFPLTNILFFVQPAHAMSSRKTSEPPRNRSRNGTPGLATTAIVGCMPTSAGGSREPFAQVSRALCPLLVRDVRVMLLAEPTSDKILEDRLQYVQSARNNRRCYSIGIARD
jgi:hypothetical protein